MSEVEEDIKALQENFIKNREFLESSEKLTKSKLRELLLAYNDMSALFLQLFINAGTFNIMEDDGQSSMYG